MIPAEFTLPPYFDPNRSRFFNLATLYIDTINALRDGLYSLFNYLDPFKLENYEFNSARMADENYVRWENGGGKELQMSSFKLTNRQMLWLAIAHVNAVQHHKSEKYSLNFKHKIWSSNLHLNFKSRKEFREAFQCANSTQEELNMFSQFIRSFEFTHNAYSMLPLFEDF